jgi:hypothetical protein
VREGIQYTQEMRWRRMSPQEMTREFRESRNRGNVRP